MYCHQSFALGRAARGRQRHVHATFRAAKEHRGFRPNRARNQRAALQVWNGLPRAFRFRLRRGERAADLCRPRHDDQSEEYRRFRRPRRERQDRGVDKRISQRRELRGSLRQAGRRLANCGVQRGAVGGIAIGSFQTLTFWEQTRKSTTITGTLGVEKFQAEGLRKIPVLALAPRAAQALFQGEQYSATKIFNGAASGEPVASFSFKPEKKISFTVVAKSERVFTQNVIGVLEGSDASLKKEYVALGAHYDHVGVGTPINGDAIYNGADDDGSGTVSILAIAEAFAKGARPKRSLLFVWHAGEEKGLWGSKYFTEHPTVPLDKIVAQLNLDMVGRAQKANDANTALAKQHEVFVVGSKKMSTELGALSEAVNKAYYNLAFNYKYDDPKDPEKIFFRSDHFNYALKGIPIIFYTDGEHEDYHKVTDHVEKIDFENMLKISRTVYAMAQELGNGKRPVVDKKLLPEELKGF
ncbi:M20/M25/M40 family metallo-hydrolase [Cytophagia bacterium CHB2]|nr:M20/M25/M40 family metallo-hydrolase [Cytophagia bacterium CHB2]